MLPKMIHLVSPQKHWHNTNWKYQHHFEETKLEEKEQELQGRKKGKKKEWLLRIIQVETVDEEGVVSIGESERRRWLVVTGGEVTAPDYAVSVSHSNIVLHAPFLWKPLKAQNLLNRIGEPVVNVESKWPQPVTDPGIQSQE